MTMAFIKCTIFSLCEGDSHMCSFSQMCQEGIPLRMAALKPLRIRIAYCISKFILWHYISIHLLPHFGLLQTKTFVDARDLCSPQ